jgi:hypothetical protein
MRRLWLGLALVTLDALWVGAWWRWLAAAGLRGLQPLRPPGMLATVGIGLTAILVTRLLLRSHGRVGRLRVLSIGAAILTFLVISRVTVYRFGYPPDASWLLRLPTDLFGNTLLTPSARILAVTTAFIWWRGTRYGRLRPTPAVTRHSVGLALVALAGLAVVVRLTYAVDLGPWILAALVVALAALALARLEDATAGYGGTGAAFGPTWAITLAGAVVAVLAVAAALTPVLSLAAARALFAALAPLPAVIVRVALVVLVELGQAVLLLIARAYEWLFRMLGNSLPNSSQVQPPLPQELQPPGLDEVLTQVPVWLQVVVRVAIAGLVIALTALLLARSLRRYRGLEHGGELAERQSLLSARRVAEDLAAAWHSAVATARAAVGRIRPGPGGVRGIYADFLQLMAGCGVRRQPARTPNELCPRAASALPEAAGEIRALTDAYVAVRYGEHDPGPDELATVREVWHRIQRVADGRLAGRPG